MKFIDWFETYFDNFSRDKRIDNSPAFGICYRARNSKYLSIEDSSVANIREGIPIIYELSSQEDSLHDLSFITNLNNKLRKTFEAGKTENYNFKIELVPISFDSPNQSEELKNNLPTFLYVCAGMTKEFYWQNKNKRDAKKLIDNMGVSTLLWSLKNGKDPLEIIFNYHLEEAPNEILRKIKGRDLDEFIKFHSSEDL